MITLGAQKELERLQELHELITGDYLTNTSNENYLYIKNKIVKDSSYTGLLNSGSGIFTSVAEIYGNYIGEPEINIKFDPLKEAIEDLLTLSFCIFTIAREDNEWKIKYTPASQYVYDKGEYHIITTFTRYNEHQMKEYYMLKQTYLIGRVENKLYKLHSKGDLQTGKEVPLDSIQDTINMEPVQLLGMDIPTIYFCYTSNTGFEEKSEIEKILPQVYSIERKIVETDVQFLRHIDPFVLMSNISQNIAIKKKALEGKRVDLAEFGRVIMGEENAKIEFINYRNDLIKEAIAYEDKQLRRIAAMTGINVDALGLDPGGGAISGQSRILMQGTGIRKVEMIRQKIEIALVKVMQAIGLPEEDQSVVWNDIVTKSDNELVEELSKAREARLISQERAIIQYLGMTEEEAQKEILKINSTENEDSNTQSTTGNETENGGGANSMENSKQQ